MEYGRKTIDGQLFEKMIYGGAACLQANLKTVNDLNVFPIPDGDTGENMYLTLSGGVDELKNGGGDSLGDKAATLAKGMLFGARGNSGVILSQLFFGLSEGLSGLEEADAATFCVALSKGVERAYGAVAHPVEGTVLTVAREAAENVKTTVTVDTTLETFFGEYLSEMKASLERTPEQLAVLKEAGVVDSGGAGLVYITEGFCRVLKGEESELAIASAENKKSLDFSKFNEDSVMEFGYCTELLLQLQKSKIDPASFSIEETTEFLNSIGDSVVIFQTGTVVKLHVHTMTPYRVLEYCQRFGEYLTVKIENMTLQHNETVAEKEETKIKMPKRARRKYAVVTVASGEGFIETLKELGADYVVAGGQTNNPSAEAFIEAFETVNADHVFVLPNNGNVILSAKQAAKMYEDSTIHVIESRSVGEGYSALSMLDYGSDDPETIAALMTESMQGSITGSVARAVRNAKTGDVKVTKDDYLALIDHTVVAANPSKTQALCLLAEKLKVGEREFAILIYGKSVTDEEKESIQTSFAENYPRVELYEIDGGQDVYDLLLLVE